VTIDQDASGTASNAGPRSRRTAKVAEPDLADEAAAFLLLDREQAVAHQRPVAGIAQQPRPRFVAAHRPTLGVAELVDLRHHPGIIGEVAEPERPQDEPLGLETRRGAAGMRPSLALGLAAVTPEQVARTDRRGRRLTRLQPVDQLGGMQHVGHATWTGPRPVIAIVATAVPKAPKVISDAAMTRRHMRNIVALRFPFCRGDIAATGSV
jgi:hypothetical protein